MTMSACRRTATIGSAIAVALVAGGPAAAVEPVDLRLPAGIACADFGVRLQATADTRTPREFTDANGRVVRSILAGTGSQVTLTNLATGKQLTLQPNGAVTRTTFNPDGQTRTVTSTGHLVLVLFPTDVPAGPSTTLIVGRVVYTADRADNFVVTRITGKTTDLCAELA